MAKYSYNELKKAAAAGNRIGGYNGKDVFACSKYKYDQRKYSDNFYVLYDDSNKLVHCGSIYGTISEKGLVDVWDRQKAWISPDELKAEYVAPKKTVPASEYSAVVNGGEGAVDTNDFFVRLDKEINELLANSKDFNVELNGWMC